MNKAGERLIFGAIKTTMPFVEGDRSDCHPLTNIISLRSLPPVDNRIQHRALFLYYFKGAIENCVKTVRCPPQTKVFVETLENVLIKHLLNLDKEHINKNAVNPI